MRRLSYQTHQKRSEYWVIVSGAGTVTLDGTTSVCVAGDAFVIEQGVAHRIENTGTEELVFTEVQLGTYFGEDDIVRIEDDFGR
jgi:mannose-6-phosphate isomerase